MVIKVGDKYKGKINGKIFEITEIDKKNGVVFYQCEGQKYYYGLEAFKQCLLEKIE